jgi:hypothetical protein
MLVLRALHHIVSPPSPVCLRVMATATHLLATLSTVLVVTIPITALLIAHHHLLVSTPTLLILRAAVEARPTMLLRGTNTVIAPVMEALLAPVGAARVAVIFVLPGDALLGVEDVRGDGKGEDERCVGRGRLAMRSTRRWG